MILQPVNRVTTTVIKAASARKVCASADVLGGLSGTGSRHAISITAEDADVFIGGSDVTATNGTKVAAGETVYIPVCAKDAVYAVGGTFRLGEYF